jgi:hypothetical protein
LLARHPEQARTLIALAGCLALGDSAWYVAKPLFNLDDLHLQGHDHNYKEGDQKINDSVRTHLFPPLGLMAVRSMAAPLNYNSMFLLEAHRQRAARQAGGEKEKESRGLELHNLLLATTTSPRFSTAT